MWTATKFGFFSTIMWHDGTIAIRGRQRSDITRLRKMVPEVKFGTMQVTPTKDYRYRVFCTADELEKFVYPAFARSITYGNFKNEVDKVHGTSSAYSKACHAAWSVFEKMQPRGAYGTKRKGYPEVPKCETKKQAESDAARTAEPFDYSRFRARSLTPLGDRGPLLADLQLADDELVCEECGHELSPDEASIMGSTVFCKSVSDCIDRAAVRD